MRLSPLIAGDYWICAKAASMSYGKDIDSMSLEEQIEYVKRIWDKHTNVSEHFVQTILLEGVPRYVTMLIAFQRHGFTMTERSQRYREPDEVNDSYRSAVESGEKKEDARKHLDLMTPTDCVITMNREAARSVVQRLKLYEETSEFWKTKKLLDVIAFLEESFCGTKDWVAGVDCHDPLTDSGAGIIELSMPVYSFHQFIRHRTVDIIHWTFHEPIQIPHVSYVRNDDIVNVVAHSIHWEKFKKTRSGVNTQEPLRSIAQNMEVPDYD